MQSAKQNLLFTKPQVTVYVSTRHTFFFTENNSNSTKEEV